MDANLEHIDHTKDTPVSVGALVDSSILSSPGLDDDENGSDRRVWSYEEDEAIRALVAKYGTKTWSIIAEQILKEYNIEGRTGKQCRERWHNHLGLKLFTYM